MRSNLPVTQIGYALRPDITIVSRTDLKGRITYVKPPISSKPAASWWMS